MSTAPTDPQYYLDLDETWCAHNYHPLPVVIATADGATMTDVAGTTYIDMLSATRHSTSVIATPT